MLQPGKSLFRARLRAEGAPKTAAHWRSSDRAAPQSDAAPAPGAGQGRLIRHSVIRDAVRCVGRHAIYYLKANHVDLGDDLRFIAARKPGEDEIPGFQKMLFDQGVGLIVDLTQAGEGAQESAYVPGGGKRSDPGDTGVTLVCERSSGVRGLPANLKQVRLNDARTDSTLQRLHFKGWPDRGTIRPRMLIALADRIESLNPDPARRVVVLSANGHGRAGAVMTFLSARRQLHDRLQRGEVVCSPDLVARTVAEIVAKGRKDRGPAFLRNDAQRRLVVQALLADLASDRKPPARPVAKADATRVSRSDTAAEAAVIAASGPRPVSSGTLPQFPAVLRCTSEDPAGPAASVGETRPANAPGRSLWRRLMGFTALLATGPSVPVTEVGSNMPGVICPLRTAIPVRMVQGETESVNFIHANVITFSTEPLGMAAPIPPATLAPEPVPVAPVRIAAAGQSPQVFRLCERFLLAGLDSGLGLFQFVSRSAHQDPDSTPDVPMIDQLRRRWTEASRKADAEALVLGGRYRVTGLDDMVIDAAQGRCIRITADRLDPAGGRATALMMQAGLRFEENVLLAEDILRADALMDTHVRLRTAENAAPAADPVIVSHTGVGRNAALICYREAMRRLDEVHSEDEFEILMLQIVMQGRRDRGPYFIHSEKQLREVVAAVWQQYKLGRAPGRQPDNS